MPTPNLDAMATDDLAAYVPDTGTHLSDVALAAYAKRTIIARGHRETGDIARAQRWERLAAVAYAALPERHRW